MLPARHPPCYNQEESNGNRDFLLPPLSAGAVGGSNWNWRRRRRWRVSPRSQNAWRNRLRHRRAGQAREGRRDRTGWSTELGGGWRQRGTGGGSEGRADGCCLREAWVFGEREGAREAAAAVLSSALRPKNKCTSCTFKSQTLKNLIEYYKKILIIMILNKYY
jgi:hypothetical protein